MQFIDCINILVVIYLGLALAASLINITKFKNKLYLPLKMLTSGGFLLLFALREIQTSGHPFHLFALPFLFCFLGDLFMGFHNLHLRNRDLLLGIAFFALGHVAFLASFYGMGCGFTVFDVLIPLLFVIACLFLIKKVAPTAGKMTPVLALYAFLVSALATKAVVICVRHAFLYPSLLLGIGGLLFLISDFVLFLIIFAGLKSKKMIAVLSVINLLTYYAAILAIIFGVI